MENLSLAFTTLLLSIVNASVCILASSGVGKSIQVSVMLDMRLFSLWLYLSPVFMARVRLSRTLGQLHCWLMKPVLFLVVILV